MRIPVVLVVAVLVLAASASGHAAATPPTDGGTPPSTASPFIPENVNIGDCLSSLPRPECGSEERGGAAQVAAFSVLIVGMTFIGWRIVRGVRKRDRAMSADS